MKKRILSSLLAIIMVVGMIVPMMTAPVGAATNNVPYFNKTFTILESGGTFGAAYVFTMDCVVSSLNATGALYVSNKRGLNLGYAHNAPGFVVNKDTWNTIVNTYGGALNFSNRYGDIYSHTMSEGFYRFQFVFNTNSVQLYVNGNLVCNANVNSACANGDTVTFATQGIEMDVLRVSYGDTILPLTDGLSNWTQGTFWATINIGGTLTNIGNRHTVSNYDVTAMQSFADNCIAGGSNLSTARSTFLNYVNDATTNSYMVNLGNSWCPYFNTYNYIENIGTVSYPGSSSAITTARNSYDGLSAAHKAKVPNLGTLQSAETTYNNQKTAAENQAAANTIINNITNLAATPTLTNLQTVENSYFNATQAVKNLVTNFSTLQTKRVNYIKWAIDQLPNLGSVAYTGSNTVIQTAKTALSDGRTKYGTNTINSAVGQTYLDKLTNVETEYNNRGTASGYETYINGITVADNSTCANALTTAEGYASSNATAWGYVSDAKKTMLTDKRAAYNALHGIAGYTAAGVTSSSSGVTAAYTAFSGLSAARQGYISGYSGYLSTITAAKNAYDLLKTAYDKIALIGTVTAESGDAITLARSKVTAAESGLGISITDNSRITNYTTLTAAETAFLAFQGNSMHVDGSNTSKYTSIKFTDVESNAAACTVSMDMFINSIAAANTNPEFTIQFGNGQLFLKYVAGYFNYYYADGSTAWDATSSTPATRTNYLLEAGKFYNIKLVAGASRFQFYVNGTKIVDGSWSPKYGKFRIRSKGFTYDILRCAFNSTVYTGTAIKNQWPVFNAANDSNCLGANAVSTVNASFNAAAYNVANVLAAWDAYGTNGYSAAYSALSETEKTFFSAIAPRTTVWRIAPTDTYSSIYFSPAKDNTEDFTFAMDVKINSISNTNPDFCIQFGNQLHYYKYNFTAKQFEWLYKNTVGAATWDVTASDIAVQAFPYTLEAGKVYRIEITLGNAVGDTIGLKVNGQVLDERSVNSAPTPSKIWLRAKNVSLDVLSVKYDNGTAINLTDAPLLDAYWGNNATTGGATGKYGGCYVAIIDYTPADYLSVIGTLVDFNSDTTKDKDTYSDLFDAYNEMSAEEKASVVKPEGFDTMLPVYNQIQAITATSLATATSAQLDELIAAKNAYYELSAEQQKLVDKSKISIVPLAFMSGTLDSSKTKSNMYFMIKDTETATAAEKAKFEITFAGETYYLTSEGVEKDTLSYPGYTCYIFHLTVPARQMSTKYSYGISYNGKSFTSGGMTSVAAYAKQLLTYTDNNNPTNQTNVRTTAQRLLEYGKAAEQYWEISAEGSLAVDGSVALPSATVSGSVGFDGDAFHDFCAARPAIPVIYSAINVTFLSDTALSIAFTVKSSSNAKDAKDWVDDNVTLNGASVSALTSTASSKNGTGTFHYVIITVPNVPLSNISTPYALSIGGQTYNISVLDYIIKAQASSKETLRNLTKGLYAYANAAALLG